MTNELCGAEYVEEKPFDYYGTEDGDICRCGDALRPSSKMAPNNECNVRCLGDTQWDCGGDERLTTFATNPLGPTYFYQGCHMDEDPLEWALLDDGKLAFLALVYELRSLTFFFYTQTGHGPMTQTPLGNVATSVSMPTTNISALTTAATVCVANTPIPARSRPSSPNAMCRAPVMRRRCVVAWIA